VKELEEGGDSERNDRQKIETILFRIWNKDSQIWLKVWRTYYLILLGTDRPINWRLLVERPNYGWYWRET